MLTNTTDIAQPEKEEINSQPVEGSVGRALLVVNVKSRTGHANYQATLNELLQQGVEVVEAYPVRRAAHMRPLIERAIERSRIDTVIVGGGDGTLSLVADIVARHGLQMGVVPLGTANDFARMLNLPKDIAQAVNLITQGFITPVDLGQCNGRYYLNVASLGLGVDVATRTNPELKKKLGPLAYGLAALQTLADLRAFRVKFSFAENPTEPTEHRALHIAVANGRYYGGGMVSAPNATPFNGQLSVVVIEAMNLLELFKLLPGLRNGRYLQHPRVRYYRTTGLKIETKSAQAINLDGEISQKTPAEFKVVPATLRVFAPRP